MHPQPPEPRRGRRPRARVRRDRAGRAVALLVALPEPFDFDLTTERYCAFGRDPVTLWEDGRLVRVVEGREVAISAAPGGVRVEPDPGAAGVGVVQRLLGAPFDLVGFAAFAETGDPVLARLVRELRGLRPSLAPDPWEMLVGSITAQQVSLRAAFAIRARFVERFGERHDRAWAFPARERVAAASPGELRALGFSTRKAEYVVGLARSDLDLDGLAALPDDEVKRTLTTLPGLGEWTADWFLARHLGRPDAWPAGDLAVRKAVSALFADGRTLTIEEARAAGERFAGHRNLAAHYLLVGNRVLG